MQKYDNSDLLTLRDWVRWGSSEFSRAELYFGHGTDNAWDEAAVIALHVLHQPWARLASCLDARLTSSECEHIAALYEQRITERIPAAYLTGEAWFAGHRFYVNEDVLVPRSPIAELISGEFQPWVEEYPRRILDLCTGSGCIGISCAYQFPQASVDLTDISLEALDVAQQNIIEHHVEDRVKVIHSDVFNDLGVKTYDLIIANPPYVDSEDLDTMPQEYFSEPSLGLGSGDDGLELTRRILEEASQHLTINGVLVVEVGNSATALEETYPDLPFLWPEFEHGGHGVFILTADQIRETLDRD